MKPTRKMPLFVVSGASGVGKSTTCEVLFQQETDYIVMESDLLWHDIHNTPKDGYRNYRELWLRVCASISQIGKPVVLCGCAIPEQFEACEARSMFTDIHYLAVVSDEDVLVDRMKNGRGINEDGWIKSSVDFNQWLKENAAEHNIKLLDNSKLKIDEAANIANEWIAEIMRS